MSKTVIVPTNAKMTYIVSKEGYETVKDHVVVDKDMSIDVTLEEVQNNNANVEIQLKGANFSILVTHNGEATEIPVGGTLTLSCTIGDVVSINYGTKTNNIKPDPVGVAINDINGERVESTSISSKVEYTYTVVSDAILHIDLLVVLS